MLGTQYEGNKVKVVKLLESIKEKAKDDENNGSEPS